MIWYGWKTPWRWSVLSSWAFQLNKGFAATRELCSSLDLLIQIWTFRQTFRQTEKYTSIHRRRAEEALQIHFRQFAVSICLSRSQAPCVPVSRKSARNLKHKMPLASDGRGVRCFVGQPFCSCHTAMSCFLLVSFFIEASWFATTRHFGSVQQFFLALCPCWPRRA